MTSEKKCMREALVFDTDGQRFHGERAVKGRTLLDQYVIYGDLCIADLHGYRAEQRDTTMLDIAKQLLYELASGKTINAQHRSKFGL